jgi:hypothetical protein
MPRLSRVLLAIAVAAPLGGCFYPGDYDYDGPPPPVDDYGPGPGAPVYPPPPAYAPRAAPGYYGAYDDPCSSDSSFCHYAWYDGPVWWAGSWYGGPHRWRVRDETREFWIRGGWHRDVRVGDGGRWGGPGRWRG